MRKLLRWTSLREEQNRLDGGMGIADGSSKYRTADVMGSLSLGGLNQTSASRRSTLREVALPRELPFAAQGLGMMAGRP